MEQKNQEKHKHFLRLQANIAQESLLLKYPEFVIIPASNASGYPPEAFLLWLLPQTPRINRRTGPAAARPRALLVDHDGIKKTGVRR